MKVTCQWNGCFKQLPPSDMQDHIGEHIGYRREGTFDGQCKWICSKNINVMPNEPHSPRECNYTGTSRHLLLSHVQRHFETNSYTCDLCNKSSYKWKHDLLKHQRKCKKRIFENLVDLLFDGIPLNTAR